MLRPTSTLPLPDLVITKLQDSGFLYLEDILASEAAKREVSVILPHWAGKDINETLEKCVAPPKSVTALDIWQKEISQRNIVTFCEQVDELLGGGIPLRRITEFCGAPGTGKTHFCLQLSVSIQVPEYLGGLSGEAVYIDTDCGFSPNRLRDIAQSCAEHCESVQEKSLHKEPSKFEEYSVKSILNGVHYIAVDNHLELLAAVSLLEDFITKNPKVKLIVIDSLSFVFRYGSTAFKDRTRYIYRLMSDLHLLTLKYNLAVVVTNHLTTFLEVTPEDGSISKSSLVPSLGDSFAHMIGLRLMLGPAPPSLSVASNGCQPHVLLVTKSHELPQALALFQIEDGGIRDVG